MIKVVLVIISVTSSLRIQPPLRAPAAAGSRQAAGVGRGGCIGRLSQDEMVDLLVFTKKIKIT